MPCGVALPTRHRRVLGWRSSLAAALAVGGSASGPRSQPRDDPAASRPTTAPRRAAATAEPHRRAGAAAPAGVARRRLPAARPARRRRPSSNAWTAPVDGLDSDRTLAGSTARCRPLGPRRRARRRRAGHLQRYPDRLPLARPSTTGSTDLVLQEEGTPGLVLASVGDDGTMVPVTDGAVVLDQAVDHDHRMGAFREERRLRLRRGAGGVGGPSLVRHVGALRR